MPAEQLCVTPVANSLGAEITGVDLARVSDEALQALRKEFTEYGVIFFRDQDLTPEQHIAFAERWGEINVNRFFNPVAGHPRIAEVRKEPGQVVNIGGGWHTDHSYDVAPATGSILYAREVPETGGDTLFASMHAAYDALSDGLKTTLETLRAVHSTKHVFGPAAAYASQDDIGGRIGNPEQVTEDVVHPVVTPSSSLLEMSLMAW